MKRYHDYIRDGKNPEEEVVDGDWAEKLSTRSLAQEGGGGGNHRASKNRSKSRYSGHLPGFKKRPKR